MSQLGQGRTRGKGGGIPPLIAAMSLILKPKQRTARPRYRGKRKPIDLARNICAVLLAAC